jgi:acetoin utilization deacetylase AcuC-like enzyme
LVRALEQIARSGSEALIVSFGADTYVGDPVGGLGFEVEDFAEMGSLIGAVSMPIQVVMEGGYAISAVADCVASFLKGLNSRYQLT